MNESVSQPNQVEALAEEFLERRRKGERPNLPPHELRAGVRPRERRSVPIRE
jgi:hypothetical protein